MPNRLALHATVSFAALVIGAMPAAAQSNQPPPDVQEESASTAEEQTTGGDIIVTGSRIRRDPLSQDAPITFVDRSDIDKTGLNSVTDVLQRLPSAGGGLNSKFNNSGNFGNPPDGGGVGAGAAEIDLRYLGSRRTLVLVDGLRFVNGASASGVPGSTDLNAIPESMIERIEVLQDGASAVYGSDAVAGVVNIITKQDQDGFEASVQLGGFDDGDGFSENYQLSWGNGEGRATSIVVGGNYVKQKEIQSSDRDISLFPEPGATSCAAGGCSSGTPLGRFIVFPSVDPREDLTLIGPVIGRAPTPADFRPFAGAADRFNFAPFNLIQIPLERLGAFANVRHEFSDTLALSAKLVWNQRKSKNQAAPLPLFVGPDAGNGNLLDTIVIDATNPFNPFGVTLRGDDPATPENEQNLVFIGRRLVEGGPRRYFQEVDTLYATATLSGEFGMFGREWFWDLNGLVGRNKAKQRVLGNINAANLALALGPVAGCTGECVPFNIFGGAGSITPEMLDFVAFTQRDKSKQDLWDITANVAGSLLDLPGGPLGVAFGVEHRDQEGRFDPDPIVAAGLGSDIPALPTRGGFNVDEAYAEINAPVLADVPFANLLEFSGAVRFSDYSTSGSTTTFKAGVNWKPVRDLRLRLSWAEGFRAPSIGELFGTPSRFDQELADPCSADQNPTGTILANCIAQGVPADGSYTQLNPQISVLTSGNPNLEAETSESWNVGGVYSPRFIPGLSIEANYYDIEIDGAIFAAAGEILSRCVTTNDPIACAAVTRTSSGQISQISGILGNVNGIETTGLDVNLSYRTPQTSFGRFNFTLNNTFLFDYDIIVPAAGGSATISREGTEQGSPDQAFPKHKAIGIIDWTGRDLGLTITGRYIKGVLESQTVTPDFAGNRLSSRFYTDVQLRFAPPSLSENFGFALGINNLFDKDPPECFSCGLNNFDPTTYDVPGRYFYARASIRM
jgi:iron complex outermembrane recepter protein